jgi:hypothetical protein
MSADYESIRERAEKRVNRRYKFYRQLGSYLVLNLVLWGIYLVTNDFRITGTPWPMWITFFAGIGVVKEAIQVLTESGFMEDMRERDLQHELEREKERLYREGYEKPKNDVVSIGDDGELVYAEDEEANVEKRKHTVAEQ